MSSKVLLILSVLFLLACGESLENISYQDAKLAFDNQQYKKSFKYSDYLAQSGESNTINLLGLHYMNGLGVSKDEQKAYTLISNAAEQGYAPAIYNMGVLAEKKSKGQVSQKIIEWYLKAADKDYANAQYRLGYLYRDGIGVDQNHETAVMWYKKAGHQNIVGAQVALAWLYTTENSPVLDYQKAFYWAKKAIENKSAEAAYIAAQLSEKGLGIAQNVEDAVFFYEKAIEGGYVAANYYLGKMLTNHRVANKSPALGIAYLEQGAKYNDANAQLLLGSYYQNGTHVPYNLELASQWYQRACNNKNADACNYYQQVSSHIEKEKRLQQSIADVFSSQQNPSPSTSTSSSSKDASCTITGYGKGHRAYCGSKATSCIKTGFGVGNAVACGGLAKSCDKTGFGKGNRVACGGLATSCDKTGYGKGNHAACGGRSDDCISTGYDAYKVCGPLAKR